MALLVGALLFIRTLRELNRVELGFEPGGVSAATVAPDDQGYAEAAVAQYYRSFVERLAGSPGVAAGAVSTGAPFSCCGWYTRIRAAAAPEDVSPLETLSYETTVGFRDVLGLALLRGRWFREDEVLRSAPGTDGVVVVSAALADQLFGGQDPVGRYVEFPVMGRKDHRVRIVGVVEDLRWDNLDGPIESIVFEPLGQSGRVRGSAYVLARSSTGQPVVPIMRRIAAELDASLPLSRATTLDESLRQHLSSRRMFANLLSLPGLLATVLASVGLYGVVAFVVAARTREFGVRMAMGAGAQDILRLVLQGGLVLIGLGVVLGLAGAIALSKLVESRLYGVTALDPVSYLLAALVLVAVALTATLIPAGRATRVDPMAALRYE